MKITNREPKYYLSPQGEFVIENYNFAKPFANFFPAIAGKYGTPMWVFYVNRGQAIASLGTKDKDHSILEFFPANKAWQFTPLQGFRTFIKSYQNEKTLFYEPFHNGYVNLGFNLSNRLMQTAYDLKLEETNETLKLKINVEYFNIPNENYAALVRAVTLKNLGKKTKHIQVLDGLPQVIPYGTSNLFLKKLGRTIEAWMQVENLKNKAPFYKLDVDPTDRPEVIHIKEGNFYVSFLTKGNKAKLLKPIVDPQTIFGPVTDFSCPRLFLSEKNFLHPKEEITTSKTPCGFSLFDLKLAPQQEAGLCSMTGYMRSEEALNNSLKKITNPEYIAAKKEENRKLIEDLQEEIATHSSSRVFDLYAKQTYLDNILRGGYPVIFNSQSGKSVFYLYSRKHGDLERDYNKFQIQPTYFSQGNGNYRDINQNRRCDAWFNTQIKDENLILFYNLIQTDGYNPLVIKGISFLLKEKDYVNAKLKEVIEEKHIPKLSSFLTKPFSPGSLILFLEENKIRIKIPYDDFLGVLVSNSVKIQDAEHGEGFWTDHWSYNLDLLENYLAIYPENEEEILFKKRVFSFYDNSEVVRPRSEKYVIIDGRIKQLHSVISDSAKKEMFKKREGLTHLVRTKYGEGEIYYTTLINKLFCLIANKIATLDPFGTGISMEADKPNWFDALNGLPALSGSSLCETLELKRLVGFVKSGLNKYAVEKILLCEEIHWFLAELDKLITEYFQAPSDNKDYLFWDKSHSLKEEYRKKTSLGLSGEEKETEVKFLNSFLEKAAKKLEAGINKAKDKTKALYNAYFINEVADYEMLKENFIKPTKFNQRKLPLFLESQVHGLKLTKNSNEAKALYEATKKSLLYDKKLKMYKVTAPLKEMPEEIGRCRVFTPGWLENESIWLHMEYKYLLELLKSGLYEEFYREFKNVLIPFQAPEKYGRSILENSSFLVSSAFPDKRLHGNGFVARLSGSTAEFINIWLVMNCGKSPFFVSQDNTLALRFQPALSGWLFDKKGNYSFTFLSKIKVTYHNPKRKNTFGETGSKITKINFQDKDAVTVELISDIIPFPYASQIRMGFVKQISILLE
ncbi:MAG: cellobiose phosphorylase [Candidatus Omnitrophota bacterium]